VFEPGDRWAVTHDVLRRDADGDYWFVDRTDRIVATRGEPVPLHRVEDALYLAGASLAVAFEVDSQIHAQVVSADSLSVSRWTQTLRAALDEHARPAVIDRVASLPMTEGMRPMRAPQLPLQRLCWRHGAYRDEPR